LIPVSVTASTAYVLAGLPATATSCQIAPVHLAAGGHRFTLPATSWALPLALTLTHPGTSLAGSATPDATPGTQRVLAWGDTERRVAVATTSRSVLVVHENFNQGWNAKLDGKRLAPVEVDGWEQAFVVPAGTTGTITMAYGPQRSFDVGLLIGLLGTLLVVLGAAWRAASSQSAPIREGHLPRSVIVIAIAVAAGALAGIWGLIALAVVVGLTRLLWPGGFELSGPLAAVAILTGGLDIAIADPLQIFTTANSDVVQLLTLGAVLIVLVGASPLAARRRSREP
jgi:arabinofuranan 3-O-arabinosyltransferase